MRTAIALGLAGIALMTAMPAAAQVAVYGSSTTGGCTYKYDRPDVDRAALSDARSNFPDAPIKLLGSSRPGYGAVYAAQNPREKIYRFFLVHGYSSSEDAIKAASEQAKGYVRSLGVFSPVSLCGTWHNTNRYPLDGLIYDR